MKVEPSDIIMVQGVKGKILSVEVIRSNAGVSVLVIVDFSRGKEMPTILNLSDIEHVRHNDGWVNLKGEAVNA